MGHAKVALVTGGAAGIGRAICARLARAGYDLAVADVDATGAERAAAELTALGRRAVAVAADVGERPDALRMVDETRRALGEIDLLVNNAGIARLGPLASF